jgi:putative glutamine amidotransferase
VPAPIVGLPTYGRNGNDRFDLPMEYVDCVRRAGGLPALMPPGEERLGEWLHTLDAIVMTGGGDLSPSLYGGREHASLDRVDPERDASELEIVQAVLRSELPALCVCRGMQLLNVALGGTLIEHLADETDGSVQHHGPNAGVVPHAVSVRASSRLAAVLGETELAPLSKHHQAVRELGQGLEVVSTAPDGVVEAVELEGRPALLAVQWHPELSAADEPAQQRLFDWLVAEAKRRTEVRP